MAAVKRHGLVEKWYFSHYLLEWQSDLEESEELGKPILYPEQLFVENQRLLDQGRLDEACTNWKRDPLGSGFFWPYSYSEDEQG